MNYNKWIDKKVQLSCEGYYYAKFGILLGVHGVHAIVEVEDSVIVIPIEQIILIKQEKTPQSN